MKRTLTLLAFIILFFLQADAIRPVAEAVQKKHDLNIAFYPYTLFYNEHDLDENLKQTISSGTNADIIPGKLLSLVYQKPEVMSLNIPFEGKNISIDLVKTNIFTDDFTLLTGNNEIVSYNPGIYYRGIIKGNTNSVAAFSFFNDELYGSIADENGTIVVGLLKRPGNKTEYIIYADKNLLISNPNYCNTAETETAEMRIAKQSVQRLASGTNKCARFYYEVDNTLYQDNGSSIVNTTNWITAVHNNISTLYSNDNITVSLSSVYVWSTTDPYNDTSATLKLNNFRQTRVSFNGDVGQLVARDANFGGLAWVDALCTPLNYSYTDITTSYNAVPAYSWTIEAMTHEFGHNLGSYHTHNCGWPIGALDDCYPTEGGCAPGPTPVNGGTIMSYCHLALSGTNFNNGFGQYPGDTIVYAVNHASCLGTSCNVCPVPAHNDCASPSTLSISSNCVYVAGSLCGATESIAPISCNGFTATHGYDVWYKVTPALTTMIVNCQSGTTTDAVVAVYSGACGAPVLVQCADLTATGGVETMNLNVTAGQAYYIRVYDHNSNTTGTDFGICVSQNCVASSNDNCANATTLTIGSTCSFVSADLCSATQSMNPSMCSGWTAAASLDQWYKITPTQSIVHISAHAGTTTDLILGLFSGTCGSLNLVRCIDTTGANGTEQFTVTLTPGNTYYIRVYDWEGNQYGTDYEICANYVCTTPTAPTSANATSSTICSGSSTNVNVVGTLSANATWHWYTGSCGNIAVGTGTSISVSPATTTTYFVRAENGTCFSVCRNVIVTVTPLPNAPVSSTANPVAVCTGNLSTLTVTGTLSSGASWHWYTGSCGGTAVSTGASISVNPTVATDYFVRAENNSCYSVCDTVSVAIVLPPTNPVSANSSTPILCSGDSVTFNVNGTLSAGATWRWYSSSCGVSLVDTGASINTPVMSTTTYYVRAENGNCVSNCVNVMVDVYPLAGIPSGVTTSADSICSGDSVQLHVSGTLSSGDWNWYSGSCGGTLVGTDSTTYVHPVVSTDYYVRAESINCNSICLHASVVVNPGPSSPTVIVTGNLLNVPVFISYQWYFSSNGTNYTTGGTSQGEIATSNGFYFVIVTDNNGCSVSSDTVNYIDNAIGENLLNNLFTVFPNPTEESFSIKLNSKISQTVNAKIYDNTGRLIYDEYLKEETTTISLAKYAAGIYQLIIYHDQQLYSNKITKIN